MNFQKVLPPSVLTNSVEKFLKDVSPGDKVLVACSGGSDSLALAWTVQFVAKKSEIFVSALVIDHQLFAESNQVAKDAVAKLKLLGIQEVVIKSVEVPKSPDGIEAAAREVRYQALKEFAQEIAATQIYLGHTLEDQVETVLMRLTRGSGARSLQGMSERNGFFVRPFLHIPRNAVRESLNLINIKAWEDPMNYSDMFLRSKIRNNLLPVLAEVLGVRAFEAIDRTATQIRDDNQALDLICQDVMTLNHIETRAEVSVLEMQPKAIRSRIIRSMALNAGAPAASLANSHIEAINQLVENWHGQGEVALPGKLRAARVINQIVIEAK
jgi:tRNA(Ile)-lysidine synthase